MPLVVLWGVSAFITNFIPNIGFVIGLVPPALMAMLTGGWQLVQSLIQPRFEQCLKHVDDVGGVVPSV